MRAPLLRHQVPEFAICLRRIGLSTNQAISAAMAFMMLATMNTACQLPEAAASTLDSGTSSDAVPLACTGGRRWRPRTSSRRCRRRSTEQAVDLAPGEEHQAGEHDEGDRVLAEVVQRQDADGFEREGDEHGLLAADLVGHPAEEGTRQPVEHPVDRQGECQCRQHQAHDVDRHVADLEVLGDRGQLRGSHQAAGRHHHEHDVHDPEHGFAQHFGRAVVALGLLHVDRGDGHLLGLRRARQEPRQQEHDGALADAEVEERGFVAAGLDEGGNRDDRQGRTGAEAAAVRPAASPRRSGNHFRALPTQVP